MAETPSDKREANEKIPGAKTKNKLDKYKWYIVGGLALLAVLVLYFVNASKKNASTTSTGQTSSLASAGIDPNTGVPYAQEYAGAFGSGLGLLGGGGYGRGATGARGAPGPRGKPGKPGGTGKRGHPGPPGNNRNWYWYQGGWHRRKENWRIAGSGHHWIGSPLSGVSNMGSRTDAMSTAVKARKDWNTRIVPSPIRHTHAR
jgi:hypothetical protein